MRYAFAVLAPLLALLGLFALACSGDPPSVGTPGIPIAPTATAAAGATAASATSARTPAAAEPTAAPSSAPGSAPAPAPTPAATTTATATATATTTSVPTTASAVAAVTRVIDGDTIEVNLDGAVERVRLILVDTPEVSGGVECFGREASAFTSSVVPSGSAVRLERDVSERDRFGRLLRYVYLGDGRLLNELLVAEGFGVVATFPPDVAHLDRMREAEAAARAAGRGLWSACADDDAAASPPPLGSATTVAAAPATAPATSAAAPGCDPSYPDVCLPLGAADYDCAGGSGNGPHYVGGPLRVLPPDPHGLDRDGDGWACG